MPVWIALALLGCSPSVDEVVLRGVVTAAPESELPLSGGQLSTLDRDGRAFDVSAISDQGAFSVAAPAEQEVFVEVSAPGMVVSAFSGTSGSAPGLAIEPGLFHAMPAEEVAGWRERFAGCPGSAEGPFVIGDVRLLNATDDEGNDVRVETGFVELRHAGLGTSYPPCFLDEEGEHYDAEAELTGPSGVFAVFGAPAGPYVLTVGYELIDTPAYEVSWPLWLPHAGVAPRFPIWLELVF